MRLTSCGVDWGIIQGDVDCWKQPNGLKRMVCQMMLQGGNKYPDVVIIRQVLCLGKTPRESSDVVLHLGYLQVPLTAMCYACFREYF